ncbi:ubiquinone biosynthesis protein [Trypanosoma grayi]|uniref:ubiquinone biosynthesis protein n=1 Tax=Trypanosoma grayi TaxID=71804 RepID=UPI0004F42981|nr:ubiquinone biosynthesis protein [Trypanosoma grayi]KEG08635.1 ubiquinone biosynthesis protein [Trypanosoma grayi]
MVSAARVQSTATRRSFWHLVGVGLVCVGATGGGGALLYYRCVWLREHQRALQLSSMRPPLRRTRPYVAGSGDAGGVEVRQKSLPGVVFYGLVTVRLLLLIVCVVPVMWYAFLTYGLGLCSEQVLFAKLRDALTAMGPSYIKFGQWMATRPDFFPPALCASLEKLYDNTEPHRWAHTEKLLRRTFCEAAAPDAKVTKNATKTITEADGDGEGGGGEAAAAGIGEAQGAMESHHNGLYYLREIETVPVNSGSIAQVHRGVLREEVDGIPAGTEVAIKVTHPYIRECISADVVVMRIFVGLLTFFVPGAAYFDLHRSLREFSSLISSQLDLRQECDNLQQFIYNFRDLPGVIFPKPLPSLCNEDVLIETFEEGQPLQELQSGADHRDVAERGCHMFIKMLFEDNFVHSDLHPGNLLLRTNPGAPLYAISPSSAAAASAAGAYPDGKVKLRHELVVLDPGLVTMLSKEERNNFIALFAAVACGDGDLGADLMLDRMPEASPSRRRDVSREKFHADMRDIFNLVAPGNSEGFKLSNIRIGPVLGKIMNTLRENQVTIDGNFASLVLTVIVGEGLGRKLTPDFNIFAEAAPYLMALLEDSELRFLAWKLRDTYGTTALLRDSVHFVKLERTATYAEMGMKKAAKTLGRVRRVLLGETAADVSVREDEYEGDAAAPTLGTSSP